MRQCVRGVRVRGLDSVDTRTSCVALTLARSGCFREDHSGSRRGGSRTTRYQCLVLRLVLRSRWPSHTTQVDDFEMLAALVARLGSARPSTRARHEQGTEHAH